MKQRGGKWLINDDDRADFVSNHEPLYLYWFSSRRGITRWVREHRAEIDEVIIEMLEREPAK